MSTKIHHGYRIKAPENVDGLFDVVERIKVAVYAAQREQYIELVVSLAVGQYDISQRGGQPGSGGGLGGALGWAENYWAETVRASNKSGLRNPIFDVGCEIAIVRDPDDSDWLYMLVYAEQPSYHAIVAGVEDVEHWPYWNNTDRPDGVTDADWEQRRITWDRVVGWDAPEKRGFAVKMAPDYNLALTLELLGSDAGKVARVRDELTAYIPSIESRARTIAWREHKGKPVEALAEISSELESELADITIDQLSANK